MMQKALRSLLALAATLLIAAAAQAETVRVTAERVNLRSEPSASSSIVATVGKGAVLQVLSKEGDWYRVAAPDTGYGCYVQSAAVEPGGPALPSAGPATPAAPAPPTTGPRPTARPSREVAGSGGGGSEGKSLQFGVQASYADSDVRFGVGARVLYNLGGKREGLGVLGSFDYFFPDSGTNVPGVTVDVKYFQVDGILTYSLGGELNPYAGAGMSLGHASGSASTSLIPGFDISASESENRVKPILAGGVKYRDRFFAEARYRIGDGDLFIATVGVLF